MKDTNVGVQEKKMNKIVICQSCASPWSVGNYRMEFVRKLKTDRLKKLLVKNANKDKVLGNFDRNLLEQAKKKTGLKLTCCYCKKPTLISAYSAPESGRINTKAQDPVGGARTKPNVQQTPLTQQGSTKKPPLPQRKNDRKQINARQGSIKKNPSLLQQSKNINKHKPKKQEKGQNVSNSKLKNSNLSAAGKSSKLSKSQLKSISGSLGKQDKSRSSLQAFLSSV